MNNFDKGKLLEDYVEYIYRLLLDIEAQPDDEPIIISRNVKLAKASYSSEFDIYYEFSKANIRHKVAIECKNHKKPIEISMMRDFYGKVKDFNVTGVFVSNSGYQSGAESYAKEKGIIALTTSDIPNFINLIGLRLQQIYLPTKHIKGEPFYFLMEHKNGELTGSYHVIDTNGKPSAILLFLSKKLASDYLKASGETDLLIRGLKQEAFDFMALSAKNFKALFRVVCADRGVNNEHLSFDISPDQLRENYFDMDINNQ